MSKQPSTRLRVLVVIAMVVWIAFCIRLYLLDWPGRYIKQIPPPRSPLVSMAGATVASVIIVFILRHWFKHNRQFTPVQTRRIVEVGLVVGVLAILIMGVRSYMALWK
jgi:O-antigen/teichoic acid export membrane protein